MMSEGTVDGTPICFCNEAARLRTSWTDSNPGRRFFGCSAYGVEGSCRYFQWVDPPMQARARHVIVGLLRKIERLEREERVRERQRRNGTRGRVWGWTWVVMLAVVMIMATFLGARI